MPEGPLGGPRPGVELEQRIRMLAGVDLSDPKVRELIAISIDSVFPTATKGGTTEPDEFIGGGTILAFTGKDSIFQSEIDELADELNRNLSDVESEFEDDAISRLNGDVRVEYHGLQNAVDVDRPFVSSKQRVVMSVKIPRAEQWVYEAYEKYLKSLLTRAQGIPGSPASRQVIPKSSSVSIDPSGGSITVEVDDEQVTFGNIRTIQRAVRSPKRSVLEDEGFSEETDERRSLTSFIHSLEVVQTEIQAV